MPILLLLPYQQGQVSVSVPLAPLTSRLRTGDFRRTNLPPTLPALPLSSSQGWAWCASAEVQRIPFHQPLPCPPPLSPSLPPLDPLHSKDGRAVLARKLQGLEIASWYFLPPKEVPGFHNEEREQ